jgi:2-keto-4-pentenoate hydratase/2-oxohepta-3-ene-1,7-dioic acid hydratase in catechol pathway
LKLVTCVWETHERLGALDGDQVIDLQAAHAAKAGEAAPALTSMQALIEASEAGMALARSALTSAGEAARHALAETTLLSPLPCPVQMRDFLCFETHMRQAGDAVARLTALASPDPEAALADLARVGSRPIPPVWYQQPIYYKCNRFAVQGTGADVHWPAYSKVMDYELEIAAVIGRQGRDIAKEDAASHVFGFTIFNDFSARDAQAKEMSGPLGPAKGKDFDGANILGPCIVTPDEIDDLYDLTMTARVNGEEWSRGNTGTIHWSFDDIISFLSAGETLYPGEVLGSGTVGNGCGLESLRFLKHGDVVELEIDQIGVIRNRVLAPHTLS